MNTAMDDVKNLTEYLEGRVSLIKTLQESSWQNVHTPLDICKEMLELVEEKDCVSAVLFSLEFLEVMVKEKNMDPNKIVFYSEHLDSLQFAELVYGVNTCLLSKQDVLKDGFNKENFANTLKNNLIFSDGVVMKFNKLAVVGNPPYQMGDGGGSGDSGGRGGDSAKPIYHLFIESVIDNLNPDYLTMIVPSRWMGGGKGLDNFRERMMNDKRMKIIVDDMSTKNIFPSVNIAGGVNYFLWEKGYNGLCEFNGIKRNLSDFDIIIRENESIGILEKVISKNNKSVSNFVSSRKPYGFAADVTPENSGIDCYFKESIGKKYVKEKIIKNPRNDINSWRVLIPYIIPNSDTSKAFSVINRSRIIIAEPGSVCTESFLVIGKFKTKKEAENFISYFGTKFFRFMLRMRIVSLHVTKEVYTFVPDVEDYSAPWEDEQLYKMFNLSRQQISFIESKIKEFK